MEIPSADSSSMINKLDVDMSLTLGIESHDVPAPLASDETEDDFSGTTLTSSPKQTPKPKISFLCSKCSYETPFKQNLLRHEANAHEKKQFPCELCGKRYSSKAYLKQHIEVHHQDNLLLCEICSVSFTSKQGLTRHMRSCHTGKHKWKCSECGKTFLERLHYQGHMNSHLETKPYKCETCDRDFVYKTSLVKHVKMCKGSTSQSEQLLNVCPHCGLQMKSNDGLKDHMMGKHGDKNKQCICGKTFSWRSAFHRHQKKCKLYISTL